MQVTQTEAADERPAESQARTRTFYHPELDVLRFGAFLMVFEGHGGFDRSKTFAMPPSLMRDIRLAVSSAGLSGVTLFFALSAFLITALLLREREATGTVHLRSFYLRRALRIWPLYFVFLLAVRPLYALLRLHLQPHVPLTMEPEHFSGGYLTAYLLMVGNWACALHTFPQSITAPLWSISLEEQFYLFWPFAVSRLRNSVPLWAGGMLVVANLARVWLILHPLPEPITWVSTFTRLDPFATGALLAWYTYRHPLSLRITTRIGLALLGLCLLLADARYAEHSGPTALAFYPVEALATGLMLVATLCPIGSWKPGAFGRALIYLGRISYGLYVFHLMYLLLLPPLLNLYNIWMRMIVLLATTATASLSYAFLEKPFLKLKQRFTFVHSRL